MCSIGTFWPTARTLAIICNSRYVVNFLIQRKPERVIHHSDRGSQYISAAFRTRCEEAGIAVSMGRRGDAYDSAVAESFFASLETELLARYSFANRNQVRSAVFDYIEGFYNPNRRHSAIGYHSPTDYERNPQLPYG